jgi:hypothetical protein
MWKLLRNLVIVALLCVAMLKLVLWYEIQQGAARLAAQLAPAAQVQYGGVSAGLDGAIVLDAVSVAVTRERVRETWRAAQINLETPGALWLLRRLLLSDDSLPEHLGVTIRGLQVPAAALGAGADTAWVSPLSLVPFETLGCGIVTRFSVADYQRMGLNPGAQQQHLEYRYDSTGSTLAFSAELAAPPFSTLNLHGELQKFDPRALAGGGWQKLHASELTLAYVDNGYLGKRNRFCAQQAGISPAQFVDQHMSAATAFLRDRGVQLSAPVEALYRSLVADGGRVSILSLPPAASTVGQLLADTPDMMTRQLNLTARRNDAPPVMVRLAFSAPEAVPATTDATSSPDTVIVKAPALAALPAAPAKPVTPTPPAATAKAPTATPPPAAKAPAAIVASVAPTAVVATPPPAAKPSAPPATTPKPVVAAPPARNDASGAAPMSSGTAPPEGSTLALVWKPTMERLEEAPPPPRDYDVIDISALGNYPGRFVRLLTSTGKKVEGHLIGVDSNAVGVRVKQPGGMAELQVPRSVIVEIQLPHRSTPDSNG